MANHGWAGTPLNLSRYVLCRPTKLGADRGQICVCKTDSSCPPRPAKGLSPLESCMGFGVFDRLKPVDCSFAENISCRLSAPSPVNLCKFACGKLGADRGQIYVCKTKFTRPPALLRGEPLRIPDWFSDIEIHFHMTIKKRTERKFLCGRYECGDCVSG